MSNRIQQSNPLAVEGVEHGPYLPISEDEIVQMFGIPVAPGKKKDLQDAIFNAQG